MAIILPKTLKGFSCAVDGRGMAGRLMSGQLPKLTIKTEEFRDGGMDAAVDLDMGQEKMEPEFEFAEYDRNLFALWGLLNGGRPTIILRGSLEGEDGTNSTLVSTTTGIIKELDAGDWKAPSEKTGLKLRQSALYYRLDIDGETVIEIDILNGIRMIEGVDQLAARRQALGI